MSELTARNVRKKKATKTRPVPYVSPANIQRPPKAQHELNEAFAIVFKGAAAERVLTYLRSITTNQVMAPGTKPHVINYHEGARWLMGVIDKRINDGQEKKP